MRDITLEELLSAGCHFGHQANRRNPKADEFIFETRSGVNIIDLEKTREGLIAAGKFLTELSQKGGNIIFVGTKRQAREMVEQEIKRAKDAGSHGIYYVTSRWIGGTITNFAEVAKNFKKLSELNELLEKKSGDYTKREMVLFERERNKLSNLYDGIASLDKIPDALVIIGTQLEETAVREAVKNNIITLGIVDTNADPAIIDYPIPANDDAVGSIKLITSYLVDAWIEGAKLLKNKDEGLKSEDKKEAKKTKDEKIINR